MIKKASFLFISSILSLFVLAQNDSPEFKKLFSEATLNIYNENYVKAIEILNTLDSIDEGNSNILFHLGYCYLQPPADPKNAIYYLEKASANTSKEYKEAYYKEEKAPFEVFSYLADAYHLNYQFKTAIAMYERFLKSIDPYALEQINEVKNKIKMCETALEIKKYPLNMTVTNIGGKINSEYADYNPCISADESVMVFTSRRSNSTGGIDPLTGRYYEDIYISRKVNGYWQEPQNIGSEINTVGNESPLNLSADGQTLLLYKYEDKGNGDIYLSRLNGGTWTAPIRMGSDINTSAWEGGASISPDGQYLYFSSERDGGYGGKDLYYCKQLPTGDWGLAQNCGPDINTPLNENSPFIHPDGITLFFSSNGHKSMGGYDIFFSERIEDKKWSEVSNLGYPVNTPGNDVQFKPTVDRKRAYYSSFRSDGFGDQDIFLINFPEVKETPLTLFKGVVKSERTGKVPIDLVINVSDAKTGELVGNYIPNSQSGKYVIILHPGRLYNLEYETNEGILYSEQFDVPEGSSYQEIERAINLPPVKLGDK